MNENVYSISKSKKRGRLTQVFSPPESEPQERTLTLTYIAFCCHLRNPRYLVVMLVSSEWMHRREEKQIVTQYQMSLLSKQITQPWNEPYPGCWVDFLIHRLFDSGFQLPNLKISKWPDFLLTSLFHWTVV